MFGNGALFDFFKTVKCRETVPLIRVSQRNTSQGARTVGQPGRQPFPTQAGDPGSPVLSSDSCLLKGAVYAFFSDISEERQIRQRVLYVGLS